MARRTQIASGWLLLISIVSFCLLGKEAWCRPAAQDEIRTDPQPRQRNFRQSRDVEKMMIRQILGASLLVPTCALASDYELSLADTGQREYYCTATVTLENKSDAKLTEISGFFFTFVGEEQVGRSKGAWFLEVPAGETATAVFETPNAPCTEIDRYDFVVGACRLDAGFIQKEDCANLLSGVAPIGEIESLGNF